MYDNRTRGAGGALNRRLAAADGLFLNHNGLDVLGLLDSDGPFDEDQIIWLLHRMEIDLVKFGRPYLGKRQAQSGMRDVPLIASAAVLLDAGCGAGGGSILLQEHFGCAVEGVTLSPAEARYAIHAAVERGVADRVSFTVADMLDYCPVRGPFAGIWACESTEHVDDLEELFKAFREALLPAARIVVIAWCAGQGMEAEALKARIDAHYRTNIHRPDEYREAASASGLIIANEVDLTEKTVPYWEFRAISEHVTASEQFMTAGFKTRQVTYRLFALEAM
jgi:geranyl diphosphate 2-C-methyltransferase